MLLAKKKHMQNYAKQNLFCIKCKVNKHWALFVTVVKCLSQKIKFFAKQFLHVWQKGTDSF